MKKIIIINYGCGNILSLKRALKEIGYESFLSNNNDEIMSADFVAKKVISSAESKKYLIIVSPNPLTYLFMPIIELIRMI